MTLLLIGATAEATALAAEMSAAGLAIVHRRSPGGRDPAARDEELSDEVRLRGLITEIRPRAVLDMGHPFEAELSARAWRVAREAGVAHLRYLRPPWQAAPADHWHPARDAAHAADLVPDGAVVFLATGREALADFAPLARRGATLWCRVLSAPPGAFPFARGGWLPGNPPFSIAAEEACFSDIGAEWMVVRNAGGRGNLAKLEAARAREMQVVMIDQPVPPPEMSVTRDLTQARAFAGLAPGTLETGGRS